MKLSACAAIVAASANLAWAQIGIDCDGSHYPNYDDCECSGTMTSNQLQLTQQTGDSVVDFYNFRDNTDVISYNGEDGPEPSCTWWYWKDGNCRITNCWTVTNEYAGQRLE